MDVSLTLDFWVVMMVSFVDWRGVLVEVFKRVFSGFLFAFAGLRVVFYSVCRNQYLLLM